MATFTEIKEGKNYSKLSKKATFSFEVYISKLKFAFKIEDSGRALTATLNPDRQWVLNWYISKPQPYSG